VPAVRVIALLSGLAAAALLPGSALAQAPAGAPAPVPPAAPAPPPPTLTVAVERTAGAPAAALAGTRLRVRGVVSAFAPGQTVTVRFLRGGRRVAARRIAVQPAAGGTGQVVLGHRAGRVGRLEVRAELDGGARAAARTVDVLPRRVGPGSGQTAVRALQRRLKALGYVVGRRGRYDGRTARAVVALRKVTGMARTGPASTAVMRRIARGGGRFRVRRPEHGRHVEADLSRQVLALIDRGRVLRIYPTSSGAPATPTVRGSFRVYLKTPGTNANGMVHSSYFIGGYAIHGYPSVPVFNASHGCLRVPVPDAMPIFRWVRRGTRVDVYA
jgi:hypothetical protein